MAAATVNGNFVITGGSPIRNAILRIIRRLKGYEAIGLFAVSRAESIATTSIDDANDEVFFFTCPDNCRLINLQVTATDMDTNGTPTLVFDVISETSGGTETVLINDSTIGQAGGNDELDANSGHFMRDVSEQKIGIKIATGAATGAAGTVTIKALFLLGAANEGFVNLA